MGCILPALINYSRLILKISYKFYRLLRNFLITKGIMKMKPGRKFIALCTILIVIHSSCNDNYQQTTDWPQYLGPHRNGISDQKGILRTWPEKGPKVFWTVNLGTGFGGAIARDGKVYVLDRDDEVGDYIRCYDISNEKELWNYGYSAPGSVRFHGSRGIPTLDGDLIYSCGHNGDLYCIDINTHQPVWNKNVWKDFGGTDLPTWAIVQCPLVHNDLLIIASQAPEAGVVAYNKLTGDVVWKTPPLGNIGYVSPAIVKVGDEDHVVMITAASRGSYGESTSASRVVGIDPARGSVLWEYTNWQCSIPVPGALDAGEGRALITGGYQEGSAMIKIEKEGEGKYNVTELYKNPDFGSHTQPPVLYNGFLYTQFSTNNRKDGMVCMSLDGHIKWKTRRSPAFDKGGIIAADGMLISTDGSTKLYLIEPDSTAFKPVASAELLAAKPGDDNEAARFATQNWAPLAVAEGKLLIRDQSRLLCVQIVE